MYVRVAALALVVTCAAGCMSARGGAGEATTAGAPVVVQAVDPLEADRQMVFSDHEQLMGWGSQVEELAGRGDCGGACQAGEQLCSLGDRICEIAGRHPDDPELGERCADSSTRCERARERLGQACGCAPSAGAIE